MRSWLTTLLLLAAVPAFAGIPTSDQKVNVSYLYSLSSTRGALPLSEVKLAYDANSQELWVIGAGLARVFNASGMELFSFGADGETASPISLAALPDGDLAVLTGGIDGWEIVRTNFRGERVARIEITDAPEALLGAFNPTVVVQQAGKLYVVDMNRMLVLVTDLEGRTLALHDFAKRLDVADKRADLGFGGFDVDADENMLFTIQPLFSAYIAPPAGEIRAFGVKGSAPGKFQVLSDITRDRQGFVYVADLLKSAVIVFDRELRFVTEFGYRGRKPSSLVGPLELVVSGDRLYVSQRARRGVSVFKVSSVGQLSAAGAPSGEQQM